MAIDPFTAVASTIEQKKTRTVMAIHSIVKFAGAHLLQSYRSIQRLVNDNPDGIAAAEIAGMLGDDYPLLEELACLAKTMCNRLQPGLIEDTVPVAAVIMPGASESQATKLGVRRLTLRVGAFSQGRAANPTRRVRLR